MLATHTPVESIITLMRYLYISIYIIYLYIKRKKENNMIKVAIMYNIQGMTSFPSPQAESCARHHHWKKLFYTFLDRSKKGKRLCKQTCYIHTRYPLFNFRKENCFLFFFLELDIIYILIIFSLSVSLMDFF